MSAEIVVVLVLEVAPSLVETLHQVVLALVEVSVGFELRLRFGGGSGCGSALGDFGLMLQNIKKTLSSS